MGFSAQAVQRRGSSAHQRQQLAQRTSSAGTIHLGGTISSNRRSIFHRIWSGFWTLGFTIAVLFGVVGTAFFVEIMADGQQQQQAAQGPQGDMQVLHQMLQHIANEQAEQRAQINQLGAAVTASGQAIGGTQTTTEQVVTEVVQQVQQAFQQGNQTHQDQLQQMAQTFQQEQQAQQQQIQHIAQAITGLQQQVQNTTNVTGVPQQPQGGAAAAYTPGSPPHPPPGGSLPGSPQQPAGGVGQQAGDGLGVNGMPGGGQASGGVQVPPFPGSMSCVPPTYNIGGVAAGSAAPQGALSPAVAYAIQQGAIDNRALGKPQTFDPGNNKVSFQDWSDHIVTTCDSTMPGIYEVMEWVVNTQPKVALDVTHLKQRFHHIDGLLLDYAESNLYAILSTYTAGEARSLVRQARRPHGMEAWRLLQMRFNPVTVGRQRAHLIRITNPTENVPLEKLGAEVVAWENRICDFESRPSADKVSDSVKMAALTAMCPNRVREHLQLNASRFTSYYELRDEVFSFLDHVLPVATTAMDIGSLNVQGCWNCGSTQHYARDCPSGKGKGGDKGKSKGGKGSGKGKSGKDGGKKGKGKSFSKSKGKGKEGKPSKGNKGYQDYKPLNAMTADPRLGQLQSQYAKAALDAYNREKAAPMMPPILAPSPPPASSSSPSGSGGPAQAIGGLTVRSLFALSQLSVQSAHAITEFFWNGPNYVRTADCDWRLRQMMRGAYLVEATIDSGAAASVCPPHIFEEYERFPAENQHFVAANGDLVPELYQVRPVIATQEGLLRRTQFSVANVNKILVSAAQICNRGHRIILDQPGRRSYIEDGATGDMFLEQKEGVYVQKFAVILPRNVGFRGPAPFMIPRRL